MARLNPGAGKSKQKKKSDLPAPRRRASKNRKPKAEEPPEKEVPNEGESAPPTVGRMERTRRLLLAALHVWELKRRVRD